MERLTKDTLLTTARDICARIPENLPHAALITLVGELGAGKTTLVQAIAKVLGVESVVQSPTYVLMKSYPITFGAYTTLVHIDAYRLEGKEQFAALAPEQFLKNPHTIVCVEWPERVEGALPAPTIQITLRALEGAEDEREIDII